MCRGSHLNSSASFIRFAAYDILCYIRVVVLATTTLVFVLCTRMVSGIASMSFLNATAVRGCTQEDAPALEIYLTDHAFSGQGEPAEPYLRIEIGGANWDHLIGQTLHLIPLSRREVDPRKPVVRAEFDLRKGSPAWLSGSLWLYRVHPDQQVEGSYNFTAPDGRRWAGAFKASWARNRSLGCG